MKLLTKVLREKLLKNGRTQDPLRGTEDEIDFEPVVKFFTPDAAATWLFTELDEDGDTLYGLCDLGLGFPEIGSASLKEIEQVRGRLGLRVEREYHWKAEKTLSAYAAEAQRKGRLVA